MIEQIRDILIDIESTESQTLKLTKAFEVCQLVFENSSLDSVDFKALESEEMVIDSVLSIDEIVRYLNSFLNKSLNYLEKDLKGSDFETEIRENLEQLHKLQKEHLLASKIYKELSQKKQEVEKLQEEMETLQVQIDEYEQIDLEKMEQEKEAMQNYLAKLEKDGSENLVRYKRHLEENRRLKIKSEELSLLSHNIENDLDSMDEKLRGVING